MPPVVIALIGMPGTGKSTLGSGLFPSLPRDFAYIDLDTMTQPLVRAALTVNGLDLREAFDSGALRALRDAQYACLFDQVRELVAFGRSAMFVAPMTHELEDPPTFRRLVAGLRPARTMLIRTRASGDAVRDRLQARRDFLDELRLSRWEQEERRYTHPAPLPMPGLDLDTSGRSPDSLAADALEWLSQQLGWPRAHGSRRASHLPGQLPARA